MKSGFTKMIQRPDHRVLSSKLLLAFPKFCVPVVDVRWGYLVKYL